MSARADKLYVKAFFGGNLFWLFFSRRGRLKRLPFFLGYIAFWLCMGIALSIILQLLPANKEAFLKNPLTEYFMKLALSPLIFYSLFICLPVKRLHDLGRSGWWALLQLIPLAGFVFFLYLFFKKGVPADPDLPETDSFPPKDDRRRRPWTEAA